MNENVRPKEGKTNHRLRRIILYILLLLVTFLLGFVPMWTKQRDCAGDLSKIRQQLSLIKIQNDLAAAVINAQLGDYEPARQAASEFFMSLQEETGKGDASAISKAKIEGLQPLFIKRDQIITLLARSDPASQRPLLDLYVAYRNIMNR
jgi:hypothetical protein